VSNLVILLSPFQLCFLASFPLNSTPSDDLAVPTILEPPFTSTPLSKIEQLPVEILFQISALLPLPSLLDFLAASRQLRSIFLGFEVGRNALARTWIRTTGFWYLPVSYEKLLSDRVDIVIGWVYLKRCLRSGSMRNRRRIWRVVEQIEDIRKSGRCWYDQAEFISSGQSGGSCSDLARQYKLI
jgi:hypothetical protein